MLPPDVGTSEVLVPERQFGAAGKFVKFDGNDRLRHLLESALPAPGKFQPLRWPHFEEMPADRNARAHGIPAHADAMGSAHPQIQLDRFGDPTARKPPSPQSFQLRPGAEDCFTWAAKTAPDFERAGRFSAGVSLAQAATGGKEIAPGVQRVNLGKSASMIPAYKSVSMFDVVYQPKAKLATGAPMANDMVCHCPEGELRVRQTPGEEFVAKKGDVWSCNKGLLEETENIGPGISVMRVINLLPT